MKKPEADINRMKESEEEIKELFDEFQAELDDYPKRGDDITITKFLKNGDLAIVSMNTIKEDDANNTNE